jgi:glutaconyl-CoA/methylmalonyl-CoA decarboxylase subunit gamma
MKKFKLKIQDNQYNVEIINVQDKIAEVEVNGVTYKVEVDQGLKPTSKTPILVRQEAVPSSDSDRAIVKTANPATPKGTGTIKSPLPGVIINILVKVGDIVNYGDKLIILEAMKMENTIRSDKEGRISGIKVSNGDTVLEGDLLIEIGG